MKRFINALLVFVLVFTLAVPVMAATPADVKGTDYEDAVAKLTALGIINGYEDGTYRPANDITRAEFAKIIVVATGNEGAADILKGTSAFSDVKAEAWYSGYVATAASFGFVKGYEDGTFRPNNNVTGQEVVTVLLRALGYNDELPGNWPYDYLIKANSLGMLEGLDFTGAAKANRGLVAQLTANTLEEDVVTYDKETKLFTETTPFIDTKLEQSFTNAVVVEPALNADDKIVLSTGAKAFAKGAYVGEWSLGQNVRYLLNADGAITYLSAATNDVVEGTLKEAIDQDDTSLTLDDDDDTVVDFVYTGPTVFKNGSNVTAQAAYTIDANSAVKVFLNDDGEARFVVAEDLEAPVYAVKTTSATSYREARIYYTDELTFVSVVKDADITLNGEVAELSDIEEGALVYIGKNLDGKATVVKAYDKTLTGKVTSFRTGTVNKIYIDGKAFETTLVATDVVVGDEYTVLFDKDGKVVKADPVTAAEATKFNAVVKEVKDNVVIKTADDTFVTVDKVTVLNTEGKEVVYYVTNIDTFSAASAGAFGEFTLDDDGYVSGFAAATLSSGTIKVDGINGSKVTVTGLVYDTTYVVTSDTVIYDVHDTTTPVKVSLADLQSGFDLRYTVDGFNFEYILVDDNTGVGAELDAVSGLFVEYYEVSNADATTNQFVVLNVDGQEVTYSYKNVADPTAAVNDLVTLTDATADGTFDTLDVTANVYAELTAGDSNTFAANATFNPASSAGDDSYVLTVDTVVYVVDADGNVVVGDAADVFALDSSDAAVSYTVVASSSSLGTYTIVDAIVIYE